MKKWHEMGDVFRYFVKLVLGIFIFMIIISVGIIFHESGHALIYFFDTGRWPTKWEFDFFYCFIIGGRVYFTTTPSTACLLAGGFFETIFLIGFLPFWYDWNEDCFCYLGVGSVVNAFLYMLSEGRMIGIANRDPMLASFLMVSSIIVCLIVKFVIWKRRGGPWVEFK